MKLLKRVTNSWAVVVTQLVKRSLPTPEVSSSNPVIGKILYRTFVYRLSIVVTMLSRLELFFATNADILVSVLFKAIIVVMKLWPDL